MLLDLNVSKKQTQIKPYPFIPRILIAGGAKRNIHLSRALSVIILQTKLKTHTLAENTTSTASLSSLFSGLIIATERVAIVTFGTRNRSQKSNIETLGIEVPLALNVKNLLQKGIAARNYTNPIILTERGFIFYNFEACSNEKRI